MKHHPLNCHQPEISRLTTTKQDFIFVMSGPRNAKRKCLKEEKNFLWSNNPKKVFYLSLSADSILVLFLSAWYLKRKSVASRRRISSGETTAKLVSVLQPRQKQRDGMIYVFLVLGRFAPLSESNLICQFWHDIVLITRHISI